jgi:Pao retrotransposon peptidase
MYLRTVYPSGIINISFVLGKSRVSPIKFVSIHRLELQAALLGARLASSLLDALVISKNDVVFWSDSQTVLKWINSKTMKFHIFVANRVTDLLDLSDAKQWRYVPTTENPADDCSRGLYGSELSDSHRWFTGPKFLSLPEASCPCLSLWVQTEEGMAPSLLSTTIGSL